MLRRYSSIGVFLLLMTTIISCNNDFNINGQFQEKTVVFGLLDFATDTNYLRIEKTFLQGTTDANLLATDAENFYYANGELKVYLEQWTNGSYVTTITADYVDGDSLGVPKDTGTFAASPNILYRLVTPIDSMSMYKLFIVNTTTGDTITASTNVVHDFTTYYPTKPGVYIDYSDTNKITYTCKQAVYGKMYDLLMRFHYYEKNNLTGDSVLKSVDWQIISNKIGDNIDGSGNISYSIEKQAFFTFLASAIDPDENVVRSFSSIDFFWYAGGVELYDQYMNILANLGINEDYISPEYSNINGGLGMFSSRHREAIYGVKLYDVTLDSLACGSITRPLHFVSSPANPDYPGCSF